MRRGEPRRIFGKEARHYRIKLLGTRRTVPAADIKARLPYSWSMTEAGTPPPLTLPPQTDRQPLIREAFHLEWFTVGWMTVEAVVGIAAGVSAGSLVLLAFGLDSVIELGSGGVLMWRLYVELTPKCPSHQLDGTARRWFPAIR